MKRIPCAIWDCERPASAHNRLVVRTTAMPAPAFYYYCAEHADTRIRRWEPVNVKVQKGGGK